MTPRPLADFFLPLLDNKALWDQWIGRMIIYRGFVGHYTFNAEEALFLGRVANIQDLISFEGKTIEKTHQAFQEAVDAYIAWCQKYGREPE